MPGKVGGVGSKDDEAREEPEKREKAARKRLWCVPLASCSSKAREKNACKGTDENGFGVCFKYDCSSKKWKRLGCGQQDS